MRFEKKNTKRKTEDETDRQIMESNNIKFVEKLIDRFTFIDSGIFL